MRRVGLGLIGLGYVGKIHLRHCLKLTRARLVAVSDLSKRALNEAKVLGIKKTFTKYEQLLKDPGIDAVIIALPTHLHLQCARNVSDAGKHIFLEKPIARNVAEAQAIISAAKDNSVKLMIGYPLRFNTQFRGLKRKIKSGVLGDVEIAHASYISSGPFLHRAEGHIPRPVPEWWFRKELTGGGALIDVGSHLINLLRWYFGEITDVKSHLGHRFNMDLEDHAICLAKFDSGTLAVITVGWFSQMYQLKVELIGSVAHAKAQQTPSNPIVTVAQMLTTGISQYYLPHFAELQHFVRCVDEDLAPSPSGEDALKDMAAISLAYSNKMSLS